VYNLFNTRINIFEIYLNETKIWFELGYDLDFWDLTLPPMEEREETSAFTQYMYQ